MNTNKTLRSLLVASLVLAMFPPLVLAEPGEYAAHAPIACVNNTLVTTYNGFTYDPTGVTGSGTPEDPYVISGWKFDSVQYAAYPNIILLNNCDNVDVLDNQVYGYMGYDPACYSPTEPGFSTIGVDDVADYGLLIVDSDNVLVHNNILKAARLAGVKVVESVVNLSHNQVSANYGAGIVLDGGATTVVDNLVAFNGYNVPRDRELREGPNESLPEGWGETYVNRHTAGLYAENGALALGSNNSFSNNANNIVIDKQMDESTDVTFNVNGVELPYMRSVANVESPYDVSGCSSTSRPSWVGSFPGNPYAEEVFTEEGETETAATVAANRQASMQAALPVPGDSPLSCGSAGEGAVDFRLNWWGGFQGPSVNTIQGSVETCLWLSVAPPGVQLAGIIHEKAPREERVVNALERSVLNGDVAGAVDALRGLLP